VHRIVTFIMDYCISYVNTMSHGALAPFFVRNLDCDVRNESDLRVKVGVLTTGYEYAKHPKKNVQVRAYGCQNRRNSGNDKCVDDFLCHPPRRSSNKEAVSMVKPACRFRRSC
jgi:hypothetical protein